MCQDAVDQGDDLITEITAQDDFPPDYLSNISEKVNSLKSALGSVDRMSRRLEERSDYLKCKRKFYSEFGELSDKVSGLDHWLKTEVIKESDEDVSSEVLEQFAKYKSMLSSMESVIQDLKSLASEVTLHPGASEDPSNRIKADIYNFCDKWETIENEFAQTEAKVIILEKKSLTKSTVSSNSLKAKEKQQNGKIMSLDRRRKKLRDELNQIVRSPVYVRNAEVMQDEILELQRHVSQMERQQLEEPCDRDKSMIVSVQSRVEILEQCLQQLSQFLEEMDGLSRWMKEVDVFLKSEEAAFGDLVTLEAQLKESNALQDDIETLRPNVENINDNGRTLQLRCSPRSQEYRGDLEAKLKTVNTQWETTITAAKKQNQQLKEAMERSTEMNKALVELEGFLDHVAQEIPGDESIKEASQLSQRTYKLSQLKERVDKKNGTFGKLVKMVTAANLGSTSAEEEKIKTRYETVKTRWAEVTVPIEERLGRMRLASTQYGEFKTLAAQESDWLERLEKKLKRAMNTAADAEEISEELDDIENFLNNHPDDRLGKLEDLARSLSEKNILISPVRNEAKKLRSKWMEVSQKAKKRTAMLEGKTNKERFQRKKMCKMSRPERLCRRENYLSHDLVPVGSFK